MKHNKILLGFVAIALVGITLLAILTIAQPARVKPYEFTANPTIEEYLEDMWMEQIESFEEPMSFHLVGNLTNTGSENFDGRLYVDNNEGFCIHSSKYKVDDGWEDAVGGKTGKLSVNNKYVTPLSVELLYAGSNEATYNACIVAVFSPGYHTISLEYVLPTGQQIDQTLVVKTRLENN